MSHIFISVHEEWFERFWQSQHLGSSYFYIYKYVYELLKDWWALIIELHNSFPSKLCSRVTSTLILQPGTYMHKKTQVLVLAVWSLFKPSLALVFVMFVKVKSEVEVMQPGAPGCTCHHVLLSLDKPCEPWEQWMLPWIVGVLFLNNVLFWGCVH